jgi:uncharacterized membrane protein YphA (DoxX/SURF4 family)
MENKLITIGRLFYGSTIVAIGLLQLCYPDFRPVLLPAWHLPGMLLWVWLTGFLLIGSGIAIITKRQAYAVALLLGGFFLALFLLGHVPYELFVDPYSKHLGVWTNALKELALSGGAFLLAGSLRGEVYGRQTGETGQAGSSILRTLEKLIPAGRVFFSITMISFGIDHFLYPKGVSTLVPTWIPGALFWTYLAAVALIAAGVAIILKVKLKLAALLLGAMIFLWVLLLHIPRAIADPFGMEANEVISVFEAVNFTGIAVLIAYRWGA